MPGYLHRLPVAPNFGERKTKRGKSGERRKFSALHEHCVASESRVKRVFRSLTYFSQSFIFRNLHSLRSFVDQSSTSLRLLYDQDGPLVHDKRNLFYHWNFLIHLKVRAECTIIISSPHHGCHARKWMNWKDVQLHYLLHGLWVVNVGCSLCYEKFFIQLSAFPPSNSKPKIWYVMVI